MAAALGRRDQKKDPDAFGSAPAHERCDAAAGWLAPGDPVGYVNEDLTLYFLCSPNSQKASNLARDDRVSATIDHDTPDPAAIAGLSMAAHAHAVNDPVEIDKVLRLLARKFPEYAALPMPKAEEIRVFRMTPTVVSVLDYSKGFGHADLVAC
jgi:hypothetical protein